MTSHAQAAAPLEGVHGIIFLGFPLHAAGRPSDDRGRHLHSVSVPMLFLQGTRDALADLNRIRVLVDQLGARATLEVFEGADHSFRVPVRRGRDLISDLADACVRWIDRIRGM